MATMTLTSTPDRSGTRRKRRGAWILVLCLIALGAAFAWWNFNRKSVADTAATALQWVSPVMRNISANVNATGTVKLKTGAEVRVGAQLSGIVQRLHVTVGSHVKQGDVIAEIDSRQVMARIDQARTQLGQAEVASAKAQTDFGRTQKLFEAGVVSVQQFDDAKASLNAAKASVTAAQSGLAAAEVDLSYVEIKAPIGGTIASIATQQGETVTASFATPTFVTIIQEAALEVIAMVDEADIGNVRKEEKVVFTTETYPDREFQGRVTRIAPVATILSGVVNYEVAISIERDIADLRPDMTANVNIHTSEHSALLVPTKCIHREGSQSFVYVQRSSGARVRRSVSVAGRVADETEITAGVTKDDRVQLEAGATQ